MPVLIRWWLHQQWAAEMHADTLDRITASIVAAGALVVALVY